MGYSRFSYSNYLKNNSKVFLRKGSKLTNRFHCNSEPEALVNRLLFIIMLIGWKELTLRSMFSWMYSNEIRKCIKQILWNLLTSCYSGSQSLTPRWRDILSF